MVKKLRFYFKKWGLKKTVKNILYRITTSQRKRRYGKNNADTTIYVIRSINDKSPFYTGPIHNLLANYFYVLSHIKYANEKGWIPVVDQLHYPVYNSEKKEVYGTKNAWEYFWKQPCDISLQEAYLSKKVILSKQSWFSQWNMGYDLEKYYDKDVLMMYHELSEQVPLNERTQKHIDITKKKLFPVKSRVLGVAIRYGGHSVKCYHHGLGHPIQPEAEELLDIVQKRYQEWNMDYVFVTSDEKNIIVLFEEVFKEKLIILPRVRCVEGKRYDKNDPNPMYSNQNIFQTSLDYLTEMELLSQCTALIGSITSGLRYAIVRNNMNYEHCEILNNGFFNEN